MNFKRIAIVATLAVSALSSYAADIDFSGVTTDAFDIATAQEAVEGFVADLGATDPANNIAIIFQDGSTASLAVIEQVGATTSVAYIYQGADAAVSMAYILQSATTSSVAVINQR
jgi:hypothetical protein